MSPDRVEVASDSHLRLPDLPPVNTPMSRGARMQLKGIFYREERT